MIRSASFVKIQHVRKGVINRKTARRLRLKEFRRCCMQLGAWRADIRIDGLDETSSSRRGAEDTRPDRRPRPRAAAMHHQIKCCGCGIKDVSRAKDELKRFLKTSCSRIRNKDPLGQLTKYEERFVFDPHALQ